MPNKILQEGQSYTFRSYFEMPYEADEILAEFGYELRRSRLSLPAVPTILERLPELKQRLEETLILINLSNEAARREALVFPVLLEVARYRSIFSVKVKHEIHTMYRFEFSPYRRPFKIPLQTSHGTWEIREGIILQLTDDRDKVGLGEIAPLPWFGTETLEEALEFCRQFPQQMTIEEATDRILAIPDRFPACQFGFESAMDELKPESEEGNCRSQPDTLVELPVSELLPTGEKALQIIREKRAISFFPNKTFKWKIGVANLEDELHLFGQLIQLLPTDCQLRLDANGSLDVNQAKQWLDACDRHVNVEFIEQPLPTECFEEMLQLSQRYKTPIALDESVASIEQLEVCYDRGWRSIFVIKPAIAGSPSRLRRFCQSREIDIVFSTVFETEIGKRAALQLAAQLQTSPRALGFGVELIVESWEWKMGNGKQPITNNQ
jgi:o-succinylbenzoate synthase